MVAHDGMTLRDLYSYNQKRNDQPWPFGASDGGEDHNLSWDQGGDPAKQRQAARTGLALLLTSAGVPMITGGDEMYRTQHGNNNVYNLDSDKNWLNWSDQQRNRAFFEPSMRLPRPFQEISRDGPRIVRCHNDHLVGVFRRHEFSGTRERFGSAVKPCVHGKTRSSQSKNDRTFASHGVG
jgi:hypothetical protein